MSSGILSSAESNTEGPEYKVKVLLIYCLMYEGCSNMNASSFITFFTYMLQQNGKRFYKGLYATFKLGPDLKEKYSILIELYSLLNEGHVSILTNSMLRTYTSDIDERIFFDKLVKFLEIFEEISPYSYIMIL